ncbi:M56 family metallopeptidase [Hymenobacter sp. YC55]|uniref:M56 family metallopeptidase n=1 Tax=Hymenobacter sp. YC55 TaxID=3034019 RepID=UPI0023FA135F|nr:M56 family metallopeptidase [Hymenobacter sp. YC55]MDF7814431.1 M56 family metallopeptidase [Hymenobacter sp. YC55]
MRSKTVTPTTMLFPTTAALLNWMWQSTLCLGACWLLYQLLRRESFFHYNRRFLLFTPWLALLLPLLLAGTAPLLSGWLPPDATPTPLLTPSVTLPTVVVSSQAASTLWWTWLPLVYGAGVLVWLGRLGWQLVALWQQTRQLPRDTQEDYTLVSSSGKLPVSSFGRLVFWDDTANLTLAEANQVLQHELVHVRQGHTHERLLLELVRAVLWFNPFVHCYPRALDLTHEYIADSTVLQTMPTPEAPTIYAALLARLTLRRLHPHLPLTQSFTQSQTLTRIAMLQSPRSTRRWKQWLLLPVSGLLLFTFACEQAPDSTAPASATATSDSEAAPEPPVLTEKALPAPPPPPPAVYQYVEKMPEYAGGLNQLMIDLGKGIQYPEAAKDAKLQGKAFVGFIVAEDGSVQAVELKKGINAPQKLTAEAKALNEAALTAVRNLPGKWTPGSQDGKKVAVSYTVPITFALK